MDILIALAFMLMDLATGGIGALCLGTWKSSIMRIGLTRKLGMVGVIILGQLADYAQDFFGAELLTTLPFQITSTGVICGLICVMEAGSIIENLIMMNPDIATIFKKKD